MKTSFYLERDHIELYKLLKVEGFASTGGEAKAMIAAGEVMVNNQIELRKRNKLHVGDEVKFENNMVTIIGVEEE